MENHFKMVIKQNNKMDERFEKKQIHELFIGGKILITFKIETIEVIKNILIIQNNRIYND